MTLKIGTTGQGEVLIVHDNIMLDEHGVGYITFTPEQARNLATSILSMSNMAIKEQARRN